MAKRDIDFLFEIGSLRNVPRAWQQVLTGKVQNVSEHIFRMTMVAWMIASKEGANTSKVVKMCLIHDLAESRIGDSEAIGYQRNHRLVVRAKKLYTKTAKKMWDEIKKADINLWHQRLTDKWVENKKGAK